MSPFDHNPIQNPAQFGSAIRARRRQLGFTQEQVAGVIGVNRRVVGELEGGKASVQLRIALELARALGLDTYLRERNR